MIKSARRGKQLVSFLQTTYSLPITPEHKLCLMHLGETGQVVCSSVSGASCGRSGMRNAKLYCTSRLRSFKSYADKRRVKSDSSEQSPAPQEPGATDGNPFSLGKQKRRRGLQASGNSPAGTSSTAASRAPAGAHGIPKPPISLPASNGSSLAALSNAQQELVAMPPHLAASLDRPENQQRRPIFGPRTPPSQKKEPTIASRRLDDRRDSQQGASTSAAGVSEMGERAEGVLQIGASGARIPLYGRDVETILQAVNLDRQRLDGYLEETPDEDDDMLEISFNQLPKGYMKRDFDWSGQTNYAGMHRKVQEQRMRWHSSRVNGSTEKIEMTLNGELVAVLPLWVAVYLEDDSGLARLHESTFPLSPELVRELESELQPFCAVAGLSFEGCDQRCGPWRNYYVGVIGDVDSDEDDVLWPNQAIHGNRTIYNVRNGWDIARFLADAVKEEVEGHLGNLKRLQEERQYKSGWAYHMLRSRWGEPVLREFEICVDT